MIRTNNLRIAQELPLVSPAELARDIPMTEQAAATVASAREAVSGILARRDRRLLCVVGPCSIHDTEAALDYAARLSELSRAYRDRLLIVMRVYFEKPRTALGWRGLIVDPHLDGSYDIPRGIRLARELLIRINGMGLPAGSEILDPIIPQYTGEFLSWASVGARTTESQTHREMASGLSMPVGFKNATDGDVQIAVNAIVAAGSPHSFVGIDRDGNTIVMRTTGNPDAHLILRGGRSGPNFDRVHVDSAKENLVKAGITPSIVVDCSHGNSEKKPERQGLVVRDILSQREDPESPLVGFMLESFLENGSQAPSPKAAGLTYGLSVTDPCIGWNETAEILAEAWKRNPLG